MTIEEKLYYEEKVKEYNKAEKNINDLKTMYSIFKDKANNRIELRYIYGVRTQEALTGEYKDTLLEEIREHLANKIEELIFREEEKINNLNCNYEKDCA